MLGLRQCCRAMRPTPRLVLPSGVVLTSFSPAFLPSMGYNEGIGVDEDNSYESKDFEEDFYHGDTPSAFGQDQGFTTKITIRGPERFQYNGVGVKTREQVEGGIREVEWQTDYPVTFCNIVAGERIVPELIQGDATAQHIANEVSLLLDDAQRAQTMRQRLLGVRDQLGVASETDSVGRLVVEMLAEN